jgi:hypothetical protein
MSTPPPSEAPRELGLAGRALGVVVWSSFLAASLATMVCFALLDPQAIAACETPAWWNGRLRVYAVGFFFFWLIGLVAAALCWQLARPGRER